MPDREIPAVYLANLAQNEKKFYYFVNFVVRNQKKLMAKSLLKLHYQNVNDNVKFLLALNAIQFHRDNLAQAILKSKQKKDNRDYFWLYLITKNKNYLKELLSKRRLDFFVLYSYEEFNKKYKIDRVKIYNKSPLLYDIENPLDVIKFYQDKAKVKNYFEFAKQLDNQKMLPLKVVVLDKAFHFTKNYYIMPSYNLNNLTLKEKALFYALARQESRFIPAQISRSYAIGLMQMMPFLIKSFVKNVDFEKFFHSSLNVKYAKQHLKWLSKRLKHPLFIAYAYNGGIGFTKRRVLKKFKFKGRYQPFLSMEMIPYKETREYGKKVLTNYIIYSNLLGNQITLHKLLKK